MATQNINIVISSTGGVTVVRNIQQIAGAANSAVAPIKLLQRTLMSVFTALGVQKLAAWADEWTAAANKINVFTRSQQETNVVLEKLFNVAQNVRQPLGEIVALYHRLSIGSKELGTSTNQNIAFTEGIGKALAIQGTSATQARGALLQLSQAMGMGRVRAQEFNSMAENLPLVLLTVAKNLDGAGGSVGGLRQMMLKGTLTAKVFYDAFTKGQGDIDAMFEKTSKTFGQSMVVLTNGIIRYVGELNKSLGVSDRFFVLSSFIARNLDTIGKVLAIVALGAAVAFAPAIIGAFSTAMLVAAGALGRVSMLLLANPFVAIAVAVASVIAFGDAWDAGIGSMVTVKDLFRVFIEDVVAGGRIIASLLGGAWSTIVDEAQIAFNAITGSLDRSTGDWSASYRDFYADTGEGFGGMVVAIAKTLDAIGGLITGVVIAAGRIFGGLPPVIANVFKEVYNAIAMWMERATNVVIEGINVLRSKVGGDLLQTVKFEQMNVDKNMFKSYGESISQSITDGFDAQSGYMQKKVEGMFSRAKELARLRQANSNAGSGEGGLGLDDSSDPTSQAAKAKKPKKDTALEKLKNDYRNLLNTIDPASGAILEMAKAEKILDDAQKRLGLSTADHSRYLVALKAHYRDIIDPLGKYMREMDQQIALTGMDVLARERQSEFVKIQQDLLSKSKTLTEEESKALREKIALTQQVGIEIGIQDNLLGASVDKRRAFLQNLDQIQKLLANPASGFTAADANARMVADSPDLFAGTRQSIDAVQNKYKEMYDQIDALRKRDLINDATASQMRIQTTGAMTQALIAAEVQAAQIRMDMGGGEWADFALASLGRVTAGFTTFASGASASMGTFFSSFTDGFANSVGRAIVYSEDLNEALGNVAREAVASLISALIKMGIQWVINAALGNSLAAASAATATATSVAAGAATAAAWAPAAAFVSLASFGANSVPAMAGMAATMAMSTALSMAGGMGFSEGGYTGDMGRNQVAGMVHGQEFVMNADATRKNRSMLEAMNAGTLSAGTGGGSGGGSGGAGQVTMVSFKIDNHINVEGHGNESSAESLERASTAISQRTQADIMDSYRMGGVWSNILKA